MIVECDGRVIGAAEMASAQRTPSCARPSSRGVRASGKP